MKLRSMKKPAIRKMVLDKSAQNQDRFTSKIAASLGVMMTAKKEKLQCDKMRIWLRN